MKKTVATIREERTTGMHDRNTGIAGRQGSRGTLILLLIRSRMRYAAAFLAVVLTATAGTGQMAWAQAKGEARPEKRVLYVNAPVVSLPQAREAARTASSYRDSDDPQVELALYWATGDGEPPAPEYVAATRALASVGSSPEKPGSTVTPEDAERAGRIYLAQVGVPPDAGGAEGEELADAEPVRPELGDGNVVSEETEEATDESPGGETPAGKIPYSSQDDEPELAEGPAPGPSSLTGDEGTADASVVGPYGFGGMSGPATEPDADGTAPELAEIPVEPQTIDGQITETEPAADSGDDMEEIAAIGPVGDVGEKGEGPEDEDSTAYGPIGDTEQVPSDLAPSNEEAQDAVPTEDGQQDVPEDDLLDGGDASEGEEPERPATPMAGPPADDPEGASEDGLAQAEDPQYYAPPVDDPATEDETADEVAQADPPSDVAQADTTVEEDAGGRTDGENIPFGLGEEGSTEASSSYQIVVVGQNGSTGLVENSSSAPDGPPPEGAGPEEALSQRTEPVAIADTPADPGATDETDRETPQEDDPGRTTPQGAPPAGFSTGSRTEQGQPAGGSNPPNDTVGDDTLELVVADPGGQDDTAAEEPAADAGIGGEPASGEQGSDANPDAGEDANHHSGPDAADSPAEPGPTGGQAHGPDLGTRPAGEAPSDEPPTQAGPSGNSPREPTTEKPGADDAGLSNLPKNDGGRNGADREGRDPDVRPRDRRENRDPVEVAKRTDAGARVEHIEGIDGGTHDQRAGQADGGQQRPRVDQSAEPVGDGTPAGREELTGGRNAGTDHEGPLARRVGATASPTLRDPSGSDHGTGVRQDEWHRDRLSDSRAERRAEREAQRAAHLEQQRAERRAERQAAVEARQRAERRAEQQAAHEAAAEAAHHGRIAQREAAAEQETYQQQSATGQAAQERAEQAAAREQAPQAPPQQLVSAPQVPTLQPAPAQAHAQASTRQDQQDGGVHTTRLARSANRAAGR